jgi:hypothetical protein
MRSLNSCSVAHRCCQRFDEVVGEEAGLRISAGSAEKECVCARSAPDELLLRGMVRIGLACVLEEFEQTAPEARLAPAVWNVLLQLKLHGVEPRVARQAGSWQPVSVSATKISATGGSSGQLFHFRAVTRGLRAQARTFAEIAGKTNKIPRGRFSESSKTDDTSTPLNRLRVHEIQTSPKYVIPPSTPSRVD